MLVNGGDPTPVSVYFDIIILNRRAMQKMYQNKDIWDNYLEKQLWHLGLVVLKHKKAAKVWQIRFELVLQFSAV